MAALRLLQVDTIWAKTKGELMKLGDPGYSVNLPDHTAVRFSLIRARLIVLPYSPYLSTLTVAWPFATEILIVCRLQLSIHATTTSVVKPYIFLFPNLNCICILTLRKVT